MSNLTRGALLLKKIDKTAVQIAIEIGVPKGNGTITQWMLGRWRPNVPRRQRIQELYGIPVEAWEETVDPQKKTLLGSRMAREPSVKMKPENKFSCTGYPRSLGAMAIQAIGAAKIEEKLPIDGQKSSSLRLSIAGWKSGKWVPNQPRREQLEEIFGIPADSWLKIIEDVSPGQKVSLENAAEARRNRDRQRAENYAGNKGAALLDHYMKGAGMTLKEFGRHLGQSKSNVARWLYGTRMPSAESKKMLFEKCGIAKNAWRQKRASSERLNSGIVTASKMTKEQRIARATKGAQARWGHREAGGNGVVAARYNAGVDAASASSDLIFDSLASGIISHEQATAMLKKLQTQ